MFSKEKKILCQVLMDPIAEGEQGGGYLKYSYQHKSKQECYCQEIQPVLQLHQVLLFSETKTAY